MYDNSPYIYGFQVFLVIFVSFFHYTQYYLCKIYMVVCLFFTTLYVAFMVKNHYNSLFILL
jgi:hypothetical protein